MTAAAALLATVVVVCWSITQDAAREKQEFLKREADTATEQARTKESLRLSLIEQSRSERRAGNRWHALDLYRQAVAMKEDDTLRPEIIATIASPGAHLLLEMPIYSSSSLSEDGSRWLGADRPMGRRKGRKKKRSVRNKPVFRSGSAR